MKTLVIKNTFIVTVVLATGCNKPPTACFTLPHDNPFKVNEEIRMDASCSKNAKYYTWYYNDGTNSGVSDDHVAMHRYDSAGTFQLKLKVEGRNSNERDLVKEVVIIP